MNKTDENSFRSNNAMLNLKGLNHKRDSLSKELDSLNKASKVNIGSYYKQNNYTKGYTKIKIAPLVIKGDIMAKIPKDKRTSVAQNALDVANAVYQSALVRKTEHQDRTVNLLKIEIEYWKKFTLAASCILLFFIGAPLGAIIRKGGMGLPVVMAVIFFLIYHIISTVAEKSAVQGTLNPMVGAWMAIIILSPLGAFLTYKATVDSALFDTGYYKSLFINLFKKKNKISE
jgi:lipopolysaccharide export system permease protein